MSFACALFVSLARTQPPQPATALAPEQHGLAAASPTERDAAQPEEGDIDYLKNDLAQLDDEILQLQQSLARVQARAHQA